MIKIKFEANSVAELRSLITEYLGVSPTTTSPKKTTKTTPIEAPVTETKPKEAPMDSTTDASSIGLEDIRTLVLGGKIPKEKVKGLLGNFGVSRITEVSEADYAVFYEQLSALKEE